MSVYADVAFGAASALLGGGSKGGNNRREKALAEWTAGRQNYFATRADQRAHATMLRNREQQAFQNRLALSQFNQDKYRAANSISMRVADAKRSGIHPLFALGAQSIPGPSIQAGNLEPMPGGSNVSQAAMPADMGQSDSGSFLEKAVRAGQAAYQAYDAAQQRKYQHAAQVSALRESEARTKLLEARAKATDPATAGAANSASKTSASRQNAKQDNNLYVEVYDQISGQTIYLPNPVYNLEMPETVGMYYYTKGRAMGPGGSKNIGPYGPTDSTVAP